MKKLLDKLDADSYYSETAQTIEEARKLVEVGFEFVCETDGFKLSSVNQSDGFQKCLKYHSKGLFLSVLVSFKIAGGSSVSAGMWPKLG
jgi:hypothetical protein